MHILKHTVFKKIRVPNIKPAVSYKLELYAGFLKYQKISSLFLTNSISFKSKLTQKALKLSDNVMAFTHAYQLKLK